MILRATKDDSKEIIKLMETNQDVFSISEILYAKQFLEKLEEVNFFKFTKINADIIACGGFYLCEESDHAFELCYLVVHKKFQGIGIGTRMYKFIEDEIISKNGKLILAEAGSKENNSEFYKKMGFKISGIIPKFYSADKDLIQYYKNLKDSHEPNISKEELK